MKNAKLIFLVFMVFAILISIPFIGSECIAQEPSTKLDIPSGYSVTLKIVHSMTGERNPKHGHAVSFKKMVEERTNGAVKVEIYPLAQLYNEPDGLVEVAKGNIFGVETDTTTFEPMISQFEIFSIPGLFESRNHLIKFIANKKGIRKLEKLAEAKGVKISWWPALPMHVFAKKPIGKLDDLKGLKIRVKGSKLMLDTMEALGAQGISIPVAELYTAAQTGMIDGVVTAEGSIAGRKLDEVFKSCLIEPMIFCLNMASSCSLAELNGMPLAVRKIVEEAWKEASDISSEATEGYITKMHNTLEKRGMIFTKLSPEEKIKFNKTLDSVTKGRIQKIGSDLYEEILALKKD